MRKRFKAWLREWLGPDRHLYTRQRELESRVRELKRDRKSAIDEAADWKQRHNLVSEELGRARAAIDQTDYRRRLELADLVASLGEQVGPGAWCLDFETPAIEWERYRKIEIRVVRQGEVITCYVEAVR